MQRDQGTQDVIAYFHAQGSSTPVTGAILQAPVSDRQLLENELPELASTLEPPTGQSLDSCVPSRLSAPFGPHPITYKRWKSLAGGPTTARADVSESEDFFSSDLEDGYLRSVFEPVNVPMLIVLGEQDEAYPDHVKQGLDQLLGRFQSSLLKDSRSAESCVIKGANHNLSEVATQEEFVRLVTTFLGRL